MKISVIIPTRNRAGSLKKTLINLIPQLQEGDEIIIVDNNSFDSTKKLVSNFKKLHLSFAIYYICERRLGPSYARNTGINHSSNEIIAFLDDDCIVKDDWARNIKKFFTTKESRNTILQGKIYHIFKKKDFHSELLTLKNQYNFNKILHNNNKQYINYISAGNFSSLAKIVKKYDPFFDEINFPFILEEKDLAERLNLDGYLIKLSSSVSVDHIKQSKFFFKHILTHSKYGYYFGKIHKKYESKSKIKNLFKSEMKKTIKKNAFDENMYVLTRIDGNFFKKIFILIYLIFREVIYKLSFFVGYFFS